MSHMNSGSVSRLSQERKYVETSFGCSLGSSWKFLPMEYLLEEWANHEFAIKKTTIPTPRLLSLQAEFSPTYFAMEEMAGVTLESRLADLSPHELDDIALQLTSFITELRAPKGDGGVGSVTGGPLRSGIFNEMPPQRYFANVQGFYDHIRDSFTAHCLSGGIDDKSWGEAVMAPFPCWFIGSLHSRGYRPLEYHSPNIRISTIVGLIDWGLAGWYPDYWGSIVAWGSGTVSASQKDRNGNALFTPCSYPLKHVKLHIWPTRTLFRTWKAVDFFSNDFVSQYNTTDYNIAAFCFRVFHLLAFSVRTYLRVGFNFKNYQWSCNINNRCCFDFISVSDFNDSFEICHSRHAERWDSKADLYDILGPETALFQPQERLECQQRGFLPFLRSLIIWPIDAPLITPTLPSFPPHPHSLTYWHAFTDPPETGLHTMSTPITVKTKKFSFKPLVSLNRDSGKSKTCLYMLAEHADGER